MENCFYALLRNSYTKFKTDNEKSKAIWWCFIIFFQFIFIFFQSPGNVAKSTIYTILWATLLSFSTKLDDENNVMCFHYDMMTNAEQNHNVLLYIVFLIFSDERLPFNRSQHITSSICSTIILLSISLTTMITFALLVKKHQSRMFNEMKDAPPIRITVALHVCYIHQLTLKLHSSILHSHKHLRHTQ